MTKKFRWISLLLLASATLAHAESTTIAVAANFTGPVEALQKLFEARTAHKLTVTSGSTGQLYAQIKNGAPFDALLSADEEHAEMLANDGLGDGTQRFTYAVGKLALWTRETTKFQPLGMDTLKRSDFRWLAIGNPELAPYGLAAQQALEAAGLWTSLQPRLVRGGNIAQSFAMAETRNADLAFVALSQAISYKEQAAYVEVPAALYRPIRQDAILLKHGDANAAARAFLTFLRSPAAIETIERLGYGVPQTIDSRAR